MVEELNVLRQEREHLLVALAEKGSLHSSLHKHAQHA